MELFVCLVHIICCRKNVCVYLCVRVVVRSIVVNALIAYAISISAVSECYE